mmetsp:Transcript_38573/g.107470  ORF Transcript_38573/g.107470 Transcript_38573/m.107470 type:complete len:292 (+) Transcript_38573:53-928(+)
MDGWSLHLPWAALAAYSGTPCPPASHSKDGPLPWQEPAYAPPAERRLKRGRFGTLSPLGACTAFDLVVAALLSEGTSSWSERASDQSSCSSCPRTSLKACASASSCACSARASRRPSRSSNPRLWSSSSCLASSASRAGMGKCPQGRLSQGMRPRKAGEKSRSLTTTKRMREEYVLLTPLVYMLRRNWRTLGQSPSSSVSAASTSSPTEALPEEVVSAVTPLRRLRKPAVASSSPTPVGSCGNCQPKCRMTRTPSARRSRTLGSLLGCCSSSPSNTTTSNASGGTTSSSAG